MATTSLSTLSNLYKVKFGKLNEHQYNNANVVWSRIKKTHNFTGSQLEIPLINSMGGGVGSGSLPTANRRNALKAILTRKKVYAVAKVDRESIKAAQDAEGFYKAPMLAFETMKAVESYNRNLSRILFADGTGAVGTSTAANATGTAAAPIIVVSDATWKEANWELGDYLNYDSDSSVFEVNGIDAPNKTITLARISGSADLTGVGTAKVFYLQNSKNNDPEGLKGVLDATSSTKYSVSIGHRFRATQIAAAGAAISEDILNRAMLEVQRKSGKKPNMIVCSYTQQRKLMAVAQPMKSIELDPAGGAKLKAQFGFTALEYLSPVGAVPIVVERFVEDDRIYCLNTDFIEVHHAPDFGWFDDDGSIWLRMESEDAYYARYGGYFNIFINPLYHAVISGLATS